MWIQSPFGRRVSDLPWDETGHTMPSLGSEDADNYTTQTPSHLYSVRKIRVFSDYNKLKLDTTKLNIYYILNVYMLIIFSIWRSRHIFLSSQHSVTSLCWFILQCNSLNIKKIQLPYDEQKSEKVTIEMF